MGDVARSMIPLSEGSSKVQSIFEKIHIAHFLFLMPTGTG